MYASNILVYATPIIICIHRKRQTETGVLRWITFVPGGGTFSPIGWDQLSQGVGQKNAKHVKYQQVISQKRGNPAFQTITKCIILFVICNKNNGKRLCISTFPGKDFFQSRNGHQELPASNVWEIPCSRWTMRTSIPNF